MLTGGGEEFDPDLEVIESLVNIYYFVYELNSITSSHHKATDCLQRCDKDSDRAISFEEFMTWARGNRFVLTMISIFKV